MRYRRVGGVMVAALVLGTSGAIRGGSSPLPRTKKSAKADFCVRGRKCRWHFREDSKNF